MMEYAEEVSLKGGGTHAWKSPSQARATELRRTHGVCLRRTSDQIQSEGTLTWRLALSGSKKVGTRVSQARGKLCGRAYDLPTWWLEWPPRARRGWGERGRRRPGRPAIQRASKMRQSPNQTGRACDVVAAEGGEAPRMMVSSGRCRLIRFAGSECATGGRASPSYLPRK